MLTANTLTQQGVIAWESDKDIGPFFCPDCKQPVILKKGNKVTHHFAHFKDSDCSFGSGETEEHLRVKRAIYEALSKNPKCRNWAMERHMWDGVVRPDLSGWINDVPVVIEVQRSNLNIETVAKRFSEYNKRGIPMLWVLTKHPESETQLADWKILLQTLSNGFLYAFSAETDISCYHCTKVPHLVRTYKITKHLSRDMIYHFSKIKCDKHIFQNVQINNALVYQPLDDFNFNSKVNQAHIDASRPKVAKRKRYNAHPNTGWSEDSLRKWRDFTFKNSPPHDLDWCKRDEGGLMDFAT